jgi:hypothetical protein
MAATAAIHDGAAGEVGAKSHHRLQAGDER